MKTISKKYNKPGKHEITIPFDKEGQEKAWLGVVDARAEGEYELEILAWHTVPSTGGRITVRGVVGKGASLTVRGMIKIEKQAQKIDDFLEIRILLLDPSARATAEPKLEIEADDVRASHAASVGKIDETQILYLASRGLSEKQAREEIVKGFLGV